MSRANLLSSLSRILRSFGVLFKPNVVVHLRSLIHTVTTEFGL